MYLIVSYHENSKAGVAEPPLAEVVLVVRLDGANEAQTGLGELLLLLLSLADTITTPTATTTTTTTTTRTR